MSSTLMQATDSVRMTITTTSVERDAALRELKKAKQEIERMERDYEAVSSYTIDRITSLRKVIAVKVDVIILEHVLYYF